MKIFMINIIIALCYFSAQAAPSILTRYCVRNMGGVSKTWTCPNSKEVRQGPFCTLYNGDGKPLIFNGCTNAPEKYEKVFFKACTLHDFCYHNEPGANGRSKADCDNKFAQDLALICAQNPKMKDCNLAAEAFALTVRELGDSSWECSKENALYPESIHQI